MATVLAVYNSNGCVGRCDARCHDAAAGACDCICGGKNHGGGLENALANNHSRVGLSPEELQAFADAHGFRCEELTVIDRTRIKARRARKLAKRDLRQREMFQVAHQ